MNCKKLTFEWDYAAQRFSGVTNLSDQGEDVEVHNLVASFMRDLVRYSGIKTQQTWVRVLISLSIIISCLAGGYLLLSHKKTELFGMLLIGFTPFGMFLYLMLSCRAVSRAKKVNDWLQLRLNVFSSRFKALGFDLNCVFQEGRHHLI